MTHPIVVAVLMTRCGCMRELVIPYWPAPSQLHVPLSCKAIRHPMLGSFDLTKPSAEERIFEKTMEGHAGEMPRPGCKFHVMYEEREP